LEIGDLSMKFKAQKRRAVRACEALAFLSFLAAGFACSGNNRSGEDGGVDAGSLDGGDTLDGDPMWGCLGNVKPPTFPKPMVNVSVPLVDLVTQMPVTKIDAKVCGKADVSCTTPISPISNPSAQGILTFTLPAGFDGYVDMRSTMLSDAGLPAYIPSLVFFNPALSVDEIYLTIPLVSPQALGLLAAQFGNTIDMTLGVPFAAVTDCQRKPAPGASLSIDKDAAASRNFYFVNGLPTETATQTDKTGYAGIINIPSGIRTLRERLFKHGDVARLSRSRVRIPSRSGPQ
jgi:hypothetical protein